MSQSKYTTALAKGQGIIEETVALLKKWEPGMSARQLADIAVKEGALGKATAKRTRDLVIEAFAPRFLGEGARPAMQAKTLLNAGTPVTDLNQILFIYAARANAVLRDFVCQTYWLKYSAGGSHLSTDDALSFLEGAFNLGRLPQRWSDKMMSRVASYLGGCLGDFGLLERGRKSQRKILPFAVQSLTTLYLAHDLHFSSLSDNAVITNPDWQLFGLEQIDIVRELQRVANSHFIAQFSGELLRISWKYHTMEESIHAISGSKL